MLHTIVLVIHVLASVALIGFVLMQHGKGADAGAAFGSGASNTVFGARGAASFLTRATAVLATVFFLTSITLAFLAGRAHDEFNLESEASAPATPAAPAKPADVPSAPAVAPAAPAAAKPSDVPAVSAPAAAAPAPAPVAPVVVPDASSAPAAPAPAEAPKAP